jgi:BASS family bile acid:Na+ symporter
MGEHFSDLHLNFNEDNLFALNISIAIIMFGVALGIDKQKFVEIAKNPKAVITGVFSQFILLPALTFLLIIIAKPLPELALGMILVAACPGGNVSNFYSSISKGNIALSISLTAIATMAAVFMTPINFTFWSELYLNRNHNFGIELDFWNMLETVGLILGLPLIMGLWFSSKFKKLTLLITQPIKILSFIILIAIIVMAFSKNVDVFMQYYHYIIYIVFIHNAIALLSGFFLAKSMRLPIEDQRSISIETGIQNSGLALVIVFGMFNGNGGMALIAAWWGIWHIISGFVMAMIFSKGKLLSLKIAK